MADKLNYEIVEEKLSSFNTSCDSLYNSLKEMDEAVSDSISVSTGAIYGSLGRKLLRDWDNNCSMFLNFKGLFDEWHSAAVDIVASNSEFEVKVNSIELLPEVKDKIIEKLTITAPLSVVDEEMIEELDALVKAHPGNEELCFNIQDEEGQMYINMMSRTLKIAVHKEIMSYLDEHPLLSSKIN